VRELFLLDCGTIFLNHGSFGACPAAVLDAQHAWQREMERNPVEFLARRSAALLGEARVRLATYLGSRPENLVFVTNATTGVNTVARSLDLASGDEVLATDHEYGACDAAWEWVCRRAGAHYRRVPVPLPFRPAELADRMLAAATVRTKLIFLSHVTSSTALIFPVAEVCRKARERGILTMIDGAHAPGQIPLALDEVGADFYTGNCHKWLCAPKGAAFLHARPEHHGLLEAPVISWGYLAEAGGHAALDAYTGTSALERRHQWQGTRDISAFLAVPAAIDFQARHAWHDVRVACHALAVETRERIDALTGLAPICAADDCGQMAAVALPPRDAEALRSALYDRHRIEVAVTSHAGRPYLRVAFQGYNTRADADALVCALRDELGAAG
jgi:isopenicillin-N epimerase